MTVQAQIDKEPVRQHLRSGCGAPGRLKVVPECSIVRDVVVQVDEVLEIPDAKF